MIFNLNSTAICVLASVVLLNVSLCNCSRKGCDKTPRLVTTGINFKLKDKMTGNDILVAAATPQPVPDSIMLKDIKTGIFYSMIYGQGVNDVGIYSSQYVRPANVADSLVFYFGSSIPDTLCVFVGLVDGWRGDECGTVKEAGITKVTLRNQVLVETTDDLSVFILRK